MDIDLNAMFMQRIMQTAYAGRFKDVPSDYRANDLVEDICAWLSDGDQSKSLLLEIYLALQAQGWDMTGDWAKRAAVVLEINEPHTTA